MIEILSESNFDEKVLQSPGPILVEFFATWCPHCQRMMPVIQQLAADEAGVVTVYQVDIDQSPNLVNEYAPHGFPTFVVFENGRIIAEHTGEQLLDTLEAMVPKAA